MTSNHLQTLPIQTAFTDMSTARAITCTQKHTHMHTLQNCMQGEQNGWRDRLMKRGVNERGGMGDLKETDYQESH